MAQWNKLATSGSSVQFNSVFAATSITASAVTASFTGSFTGDGSQLTNLPAATVLSSSVSIDTYNFTGDGSTKTFTVSQSYNVNSLEVYVDGLAQSNITDYTLASATLTFVDTPPSASNILVKAFVNVTQNLTGSFSGSFFGVITSASYAQTASYALNAGAGSGFPFSGSAVITGSLYVVPTGSVGGITGSVSGALTGTFPYSGLTGTPSGIVSSSTQVSALLPSNTVSSSAQVTAFLPTGTVSSSTQINTGSFSGSITSASYVSPSGLPAGTISASNQVVWSQVNYNSGIVSSSGQVSYTGLSNIPAGIVSSSGQVAPLLPAGTVSSSAQYPGWVTSSTQINYSSLQNIPQYLVSSSTQVQAFLPGGTVSSSTQVAADLPNGVVSSSAQYPGWMTSSAQVVWSQVAYNTGIVSSSTQVQANLPAGTVSSSAQVIADLPNGVVSSSAQYPGWVTSSSQINYTQLQNIPAGIVSSSAQVTANLPAGTVSSSVQVDVRNTTGIQTIATTGSNTFIGNQTVTGSLYTSGSSTLVGTTNITGSLNILGTGSLNITGSTTQIGNNTLVGNTTLSGSINISGSTTQVGNNSLVGNTLLSGSIGITGNSTLTGSFLVTGSTTQIGNNNLYGATTLSGSLIVSGGNVGVGSPNVIIYGNTDINGYLQFNPVTTNINSSTSASYVYVSGSTNDLYFTQNGSGVANTTRLRWLESELYTGLLYGGQLSTVTGSTTFNVTAGQGIIVNLNTSLSGSPYPIITVVSWPSFSNVALTYSASSKFTYVGVDNAGNLIQQTVPWGSTDINQFDTQIYFGNILHFSGSVTQGTYNAPQISYGYPQRTDDFFRAFGPLKIFGHTLQASGSSPTLSIIKTGGTAYHDGANWLNNPNHPSTVVEANAVTKSKIYRYYISGSTPVIDTGANAAGYTTIDNTQYVNTSTGALASVGNNQFTIQRVFWFPNSPTQAFVVYYGNAVYGTLLDAVNAINTEPFTEAQNTATNAIFIGYIVIQGGNNRDLLNSTQASIIQGGLFRNVGGIGSSGTSPLSSTLAGLSDVSISSPLAGDLLVYNGATWNNNKSLNGAYSLTGSLATTNGITAITVNATSVTASHSGSGAGLYGVNYTTLANIPSGIVSSSTQVAPLLPAGTVSSSAQYPGWMTSSAQVVWSQVPYNTGIVSSSTQVAANLPAGTVSSSAQVTIDLPVGTVSSSAQVVADISGQTISPTNINGVTSITASFISGAHTGTFPYASLTGTPSGIVSSSAQYPGWMTASSQVVWSQVNYNTGIVSSSAQVTANLPAGTVSSSGQISYTGITNVPLGIVSSSAQVQPLLPLGTVSSSTQVQADLPLGTVSSSAQYPGWVTASSQIDYNQIANKLSGVVSSSAQVAPLLPNGTVSSSAQYPGWMTSSAQVVWSSVNYNSGILSSSTQFNALTGTSASYALTASYAMNGGGGGSVPAGTVSSSTQFNNLTSPFTGSFTGSFTGNGSGLTNIPVTAQIDVYTFDGNGVTNIFAVSKSYAANSLIVSVDGLTYTNPTDYTFAGTSITFVDTPISSSTIVVRGLVTTGTTITGSFSGSFVGDGSGITNLPTSITRDVYQYTSDGVTTNYTLSRLYSVSSLDVAVAGLRYAPTTDYTLNLFTLSFLTAPPSGSNIYISGLVNTPTTATGSFSGSFNGTYSGSIANAVTASYATTASAATSITFIPTSASYAATASLATTASFATTASNLNGGATNYIPLWTTGGGQSSSVIYQTGGKLGINNIVPSASLHVSGTMMIQQIIEQVSVTASAPPVTYNLDLTSGSIFFNSASTAANWTLNFRGDAGTTLNSMMYNGQSITATVLAYNGATAYSASAYQIDGASVTPRWQGGTSGSGHANALDAHQFTILKIASASYVVLGSIVQYS